MGESDLMTRPQTFAGMDFEEVFICSVGSLQNIAELDMFMFLLISQEFPGKL